VDQRNETHMKGITSEKKQKQVNELRAGNLPTTSKLWQIVCHNTQELRKDKKKAWCTNVYCAF